MWWAWPNTFVFLQWWRFALNFCYSTCRGCLCLLAWEQSGVPGLLPEVTWGEWQREGCVRWGVCGDSGDTRERVLLCRLPKLSQLWPLMPRPPSSSVWRQSATPTAETEDISLLVLSRLWPLSPLEGPQYHQRPNHWAKNQWSDSRRPTDSLELENLDYWPDAMFNLLCTKCFEVSFNSPQASL